MAYGKMRYLGIAVSLIDKVFKMGIRTGIVLKDKRFSSNDDAFPGWQHGTPENSHPLYMPDGSQESFKDFLRGMIKEIN